MNDVKHKTGPTVRAQEGTRPNEQPKPSYESMDSVRKDGYTVVLVSDAGMESDAFWHRTRSFDARTGKWPETGWWKVPMTGQKLGFDPVGWRKHD